ncbi:insulinase family protein [Gemella sp. zg-570]|uniref:insulinase family protein n=1 Tax=Gemella sp. zg-570 TaxID=2840371 RepID=UPI001C0AAD02|nr:insulinase family protein [Gemella sp. zg-570]QWQ39435.1 insulinase family protein [Gemella sp. zg-570]
MKFNLIKKKYLKDIDTTAFVYEHKKTKARLIFFNNNDENKSFSITFKTIPNSDNGIFHILEHSVLCGSKKYPVKEPFVELIKGSFNTFINAMTFADKTMYPVSSKNDEDLKILMDIYLDAVFNPQLLENDKILKQEGWHYHLENKDDELEFKGVVYNEMKGAYSSVDEIIDMHITEQLYSDTPYRYSYGGKPEKIVELTQEEFINTYKYCYHPSNSYIFLYGNLDIEDYLEKIDLYLANYEFRDYSNYLINEQKNFIEKPVEKTYYTEYPKDKNYVTINFLIGSNLENNLINSINVIDEILLGNNNTNFRKYFIDKGICEDLYGYMQRDKAEVAYSIIFKNVKNEYVDKIEFLYKDALQKELKNKFNKEQIQSIINKNIFTIKEEVNKTSSPKGVSYAIRALRNWLYGNNPLELFDYDKTIKFLEKNLQDEQYEYIANKFLLENNKKSIIKILATNNKEEEQSLKAYKNSLSEEAISKIIFDTKSLIKWQNTEDDKEALDKIKSVNAKSVTIKNPFKPTLFNEVNAIKYAHYDINTSNIVYSKFIFDITNLSKEELNYAALLTHLLFNINTKNKTELEVNTEIDTYLGDINSSISIMQDEKSADTKIKFVVSAKNLVANSNKLANILLENTLNYDFSNKQNISNVLLEFKLNLETQLKEYGNTFVNRRIASYMSLKNMLFEQINGYDFYIFVSNVLKNINEDFDNTYNNLTNIAEKIFNKNNLIVSTTCSKEDNIIFNEHISNYVNFLKEDAILANTSKINFEKKEKNYSEAFYFNTLVQYVGMGFDEFENYSGSLLVLRHILNFDYLWNNVRVKGGAYGSGININKFKELSFWSYRDPNFENTLNVYKNTADYIKNLNLNDKELNKYIIGTLNNFNQLMSPIEKSTFSLNHYINNYDYKEFDKIVEEIKSTTLEDLIKLAKIFDSNNKNYICVLTTKEKATANSELFSKIIEIN